MIGSICVSICDSSPILRCGLKSFLDSDPKISTVIQASSHEEILSHHINRDMDILLIDLEQALNQGSGIKSLRRIRELRPDVKIIVFTSCRSRQLILEALDLGVQGFQVKQADSKQVLSAIHTVHKGGTSMAPCVTAALIDQVSSQQPAKAESLSKRETQVLELIANGKTNLDIAHRLYISVRTVKFHVSSIFHKLKVKNRTQAAALWTH